jgi:hypothetical protein
MLTLPPNVGFKSLENSAIPKTREAKGTPYRKGRMKVTVFWVTAP